VGKIFLFCESEVLDIVFQIARLWTDKFLTTFLRFVLILVSQLRLGLPSDVFPSAQKIIEEHITSHVTNIYVKYAKQQHGKHKAGLQTNSLLSFIEH
jgi:hypothetical protein